MACDCTLLASKKNKAPSFHTSEHANWEQYPLHMKRSKQNAKSRHIGTTVITDTNHSFGLIRKIAMFLPRKV